VLPNSGSPVRMTVPAERTAPVKIPDGPAGNSAEAPFPPLMAGELAPPTGRA
jgi:hypothetical protein